MHVVMYVHGVSNCFSSFKPKTFLDMHAGMMALLNRSVGVDNLQLHAVLAVWWLHTSRAQARILCPIQTTYTSKCCTPQHGHTVCPMVLSVPAGGMSERRPRGLWSGD